MMAEPNFLSIYSLCEQAEARGKRKEDPICDHACLKGSSRATGVRRGGKGTRGGPEGRGGSDRDIIKRRKHRHLPGKKSDSVAF